MKNLIFILFVVLLYSSCKSKSYILKTFSNNVYIEKRDLYDSSRNRKIPIAIFSTKNIKYKSPIIINHSYGANSNISYLMYKYLCYGLAENGFEVVSIQNELPNDSLMDISPPIIEKRTPFWESIALNTMFVKEYLQRSKGMNLENLILIGHSNGGDANNYYITKIDSKVSHNISLDNRRYPLPYIENLKTLFIGSSDVATDENIISKLKKTKNFSYIKLKDTRHNFMDDTATEEQEKEILTLIFKFLLIAPPN